MARNPEPQKTVTWRDRVPTWNGFRAVGESRVLRSSYVWLVIVPVAARMVEKIQSPLDLTTVLGIPVTLNVDLPFSWKAFFFAAVAFTAASLIYLLRCPVFVREHKDFADFTSKGKKQLHIGRAAKAHEGRIKDGWELGEFIDSYNSWIHDDFKRVVDTEESRRSTFWLVFDRLDADYFGWRAVLACLYLIGFLLIGMVALQNIYYVLRLSW